MTVLKLIESGGHYGDLNLIGDGKDSMNADTALLIRLKAGEVAEFGDVKTGYVFNPVIVMGAGKVIMHSLDNQYFGGDGIQARTSGLHIQYTNVENVTPTRPYNTCERVGNESISECLARNNEVVLHPSLLSWERHKNYKNEVLPGYHVDALIQLYATKSDGYTLDPHGVISDIRMPHVRARVKHPKVQLAMASENNDYKGVEIGTETLDVDMPYMMPFVFNTLRDSKIGCVGARLPKGSCIKINEVKPRPSSIPVNTKRTFNNVIQGFAPECIIEQCSTVDTHTEEDYMHTHAANDAPISGARHLFDREILFSTIRRSLFGGSMNQDQVDGVNLILAHWEENHPTEPVEFVAYSLANAYHEVDRTMQPIKEYGGYSYYMRMYDITGDKPGLAKRLGNIFPGDGAKFPGMGHTMNTGRYNYDNQGKKHGVNLINDPELIMRDAELSVAIMIEGMLDGDFTGRSLYDFMKNGKFDPIAARRIINGFAKPKQVKGIWIKKPVAKKIAGYYKLFLVALNKSNASQVAENNNQGVVEKLKRATDSRTMWGGGAVLTGVASAGSAASALIDQVKSAAVKAASDPVGAITTVVDGSKVISQKTAEAVEHVSGVAAMFGFTQSEYISFLSWGFGSCLLVITIGGGLVIYARWDDLTSGKNP